MLREGLEVCARSIRDVVLAATGISVSVGVSSERTFARYLHEDHTVERELLRLCVSVTSALPDAKARHGQGA